MRWSRDIVSAAEMLGKVAHEILAAEMLGKVAMKF